MKGETYEEFVEKFKPKKTTDDCYTPDNIYKTGADWVAKEYSVDSSTFVRPFYPGGDYENFCYGDNKIVVDNPPFSILSKIINYYIEHNIKFFLFAPGLTLFSNASERCAALAVGARITYENGAEVCTSFVTNLEPENVRIRTVPELYESIKKVNEENRKATHKQLPKYSYPPYVVTAAQIQKYSHHGIEMVIPHSESLKVRKLDSQGGKGIFGNGYFVSERCKNLVKDAERRMQGRMREEGRRIDWRLSDRELSIIKKLSEG